MHILVTIQNLKYIEEVYSFTKNITGKNGNERCSNLPLKEHTDPLQGRGLVMQKVMAAWSNLSKCLFQLFKTF